MHLKRLKVRNFKSFAGSTEIPFQPGFTGVAGPNGMGKSNISDAILFVLGPTSSKALRADRLTHLFFNGGASKKPANECEVSLVFDNADRLLPVESEEVEITRYVKLAPSDPNGYYSYFYVNGRRSTQSEIDSILSHARLSGDGYNLVQQGDVNRIISMGPVPRRSLVERLAGISQYDEELERAEAKRTDLEANMTRINTLLGEIKGHIAALESQRLQAIQYKQVQDQKRHAEARLARAGHQIARQEVASCEAQLAKLNGEVETLRTETQKLENERAEVAASIEKIEKEIAERGGPEAEKFKAQLDEKRMAFARLEESVSNAQTELQGLNERLSTLTDQIKASDAEAKQLTAKEKELAVRLDETEKTLETRVNDLKATTSEADQSQGKLAGTRKEILTAERQLGERQKEWEGVVASREAAKASLAAAERDLAQAEDDRRTRELELKDAELRGKEAGGPGGKGASSADLQKELFQVKAKEKALREEVERLSREVLELNRQYTALDARLKVRAEKGGGAASQLAAVDFLLSQRNLGKIPGIRGTVQELARFEAGHETALSVAAGNRIQALVVETDEVAEQCIQLLRQEKRGRATFLPLNKMLAGRPKGKSMVVAQSDGAVGFALDLVKFDEELRPAFWYVFGETVVMEDLGRARAQMGGVRLVTLQGDLIEATGAIQGGYIDVGKRREAETSSDLKRIGEELREKSGAEAAAKAELDKLSERFRVLSEELAKRSGRADAADQARALLQRELDTARERLKETTQRIREVTSAQERAEAALAKADAESARLTSEIARLKEARDKLQQEYLGHLPASLSKRIQALQEQNQAAHEDRLAVSKEIEAVRASLAAATKSLEERRVEQAGLKKAVDERTKTLAATKKSRDAAKEALEALRTVESKTSSRVQGLTEEKRALDERRLKLVDKVARGQESLQTRLGLVQAEEVRLATARQHFAEVEEALKQFPEPAADEPPVPLEELKRSIQSLQGQLDAMGSVNLMALEEYDQEKSRLDGFTGEVDRLGAEKAELLQLVREIEKKKKEKLVEVVTHVNDAYRGIYADLSGGGEGEIALENPADPLAAGLLIRARPVGKNIQRLEQLSGGEKSLASLAFVFALQHYDPSPLYVFDEIDMSLDGVNAENVGRMLRRNAERAQFIVISLRKVTLKFAHQLFGVTMRGDGVSHVVSLRLDEIIDVDERERERAAEAAPALPAAPGAA
jgi:chromosome segregation protein